MMEELGSSETSILTRATHGVTSQKTASFNVETTIRIKLRSIEVSVNMMYSGCKDKDLYL
jgi:hypothetical protein